MSVDKLLRFEDDGLETPTVGIWGEEKYNTLKCFDDIFSEGMKKKMDQRVYIDLFAGAGRAKIRESKRIVATSATIALSVNTPFDKYIFCERDKQNMDALKRRVERDYPCANVAYLLGDCNKMLDRIISEIPKGRNVLSFCFVDPFGINIDFNIIRELSTNRAMDFLILLAIGMDANRNKKLYSTIENEKIDRFLGINNWRERFNESINNNNFRRFLMKEYSNQMERIGYLKTPLKRMKAVNRGSINLYHLAFFSKHQLGYKFWDEARKYGTNQLSLGI